MYTQNLIIVYIIYSWFVGKKIRVKLTDAFGQWLIKHRVMLTSTFRALINNLF